MLRRVEIGMRLCCVLERRWVCGCECGRCYADSAASCASLKGRKVEGPLVAVLATRSQTVAQKNRRSYATGSMAEDGSSTSFCWVCS